jgi:hypothetical protein
LTDDRAFGARAIQFVAEVFSLRFIVVGVVLMFQFPVVCQENQLKHVLISPPDGGPAISLEGLEISRDISTTASAHAVELKGRAQIRTTLCGHEVPNRKMVVLRADTAIYHEDTGEIEANGNVHVTFER